PAMTARRPVRYGSTSRGGITFCISVPGCTADATWSACRTRSPCDQNVIGCHETLITQNTPSTASTYLTRPYRRQATRALARPAPCLHYIGSVSPQPAGQQSQDDDGSAWPEVASALAAYADGSGSEHAALTALAGSRLLVPLLAESAPEGGAVSQVAVPSL